MNEEFKKQLIESIPFRETDRFFIEEPNSPPSKARKAIDKILALGVSNPDEMIRLLDDERLDDELFSHIISFLGWLKYEPAVQALMKIAKSEEKSLEVRRSAMIYLADLAKGEAYTVLSPLILHHSNPEIRLTAMAALSLAPSERVFELIIEILEQERSSAVRREAVRAVSSISQINKEQAYAFFVARSMNTEEEAGVRAYAIEGLGHLGDRRALNIVIRSLSSKAPEIRSMAAYALGMLGDISHLSLLEKMRIDSAVFDSWGTVADSAEVAIEQIQSRSSCNL